MLKLEKNYQQKDKFLEIRMISLYQCFIQIYLFDVNYNIEYRIIGSKKNDSSCVCCILKDVNAENNYR